MLGCMGRCESDPVLRQRPLSDVEKKPQKNRNIMRGNMGIEVAQRDSGLRVCVSQTDHTRGKAARALKGKVRKFSSSPSKSAFWRAG